MVYIFSLFLLIILYNNCAGQNGLESIKVTTSGASVTQFDEVGSSFSGKMTASLQYISLSGDVSGYALDPANKTKVVRVYFFANGPVGSGSFMGETVAHLSNLGIYNGHFFSFQIPDQFRDGKSHSIFAYVHDKIPSLQIVPDSVAPVTQFTAFLPKAESVYNARIKPTIDSTCVDCHTWTYSSLYYGSLLVKLPTEGGTSTNNLFITKMLGHGGGTYCNSTDNDFCASIQAWWNAEFK